LVEACFGCRRGLLRFVSHDRPLKMFTAKECHLFCKMAP
jgi:hypothetical protein